MSNILISDFSPHLFWDTDREKLDLKKDGAYIIKQVLEYGKLNDWHLIKEYSLSKILDFYKEKYFDASPYLALKSLTFFEDAEQDTNPVMIQKAEWEQVKKEILKRVKEYIKR
jgi:hypothetical protein